MSFFEKCLEIDCPQVNAQLFKLDQIGFWSEMIITNEQQME